MMFGCSPPLTMIPWTRASGRSCWRSWSSATKSWMTAFSALTPRQGHDEARRLAVELRLHLDDAERRPPHLRAAAPVDHHRGVHALEDARLHQLDLARATLLGGRADHLD